MHVLSVNSLSWHGEIERDDSNLCSTMMVELSTRKRAMRDEDENDVRIRANMRKQGYDLPDWVGRTVYQRYHTQDRDSYRPYQ
jgi:hypothetical protein